MSTSFGATSFQECKPPKAGQNTQQPGTKAIRTQDKQRNSKWYMGQFVQTCHKINQIFCQFFSFWCPWIFDCFVCLTFTSMSIICMSFQKQKREGGKERGKERERGRKSNEKNSKVRWDHWEKIQCHWKKRGKRQKGFGLTVSEM